MSLHMVVEMVSVDTPYLPDCCPAALWPSLLLVLLRRASAACAASPPQTARIYTLNHKALVALVCGVEEGACTAVVVPPTSWIGHWHTQAPRAALGHVLGRGG